MAAEARRLVAAELDVAAPAAEARLHDHPRAVRAPAAEAVGLDEARARMRQAGPYQAA